MIINTIIIITTTISIMIIIIIIIITIRALPRHASSPGGSLQKAAVSSLLSSFSVSCLHEQSSSTRTSLSMEDSLSLSLSLSISPLSLSLSLPLSLPPSLPVSLFFPWAHIYPCPDKTYRFIQLPYLVSPRLASARLASPQSGISKRGFI